MAVEETNVYGLVIFYDCCIPRSQFAEILPWKIQCAKHVFVRDVFPEAICRNDFHLFSRIEDLRSKHYPLSACVFITQDQKFDLEVEKHPALNTSIRLMIIDPCNCAHQNYLRANQVANQLVAEYASLFKEEKESR